MTSQQKHPQQQQQAKVTPTLQQITKFMKGAKGFDELLQYTLTAVSADGTATAEMKVLPQYVNGFGKMHGVMYTALVDVIGTLAIIAGQDVKQMQPGVSTDINISFFFGADLGQTIVAEARTLKYGKSVSFVEVEMREQASNKLLAKGRMTKAMTNPLQPKM